MGDYATGLYFFTLWASAGNESAVALREYAVRVFGKPWIEELGKYNHGVNFGAFGEIAQDMIEDGASATEPTKAEIYGAILKAAGTVPSLLDAVLGTGADLGRKVPGAIEAVGNWSEKIAMYGAIIAVAVIVVYAAKNAEAISGAFKKALAGVKGAT